MANTRIYTDEQVAQLVNFVLQSRGISGDAAELTHADVENYMNAGGRYAADGPGTKITISYPQPGAEFIKGTIVSATISEEMKTYLVRLPLDNGEHTYINEVNSLYVVPSAQVEE